MIQNVSTDITIRENKNEINNSNDSVEKTSTVGLRFLEKSFSSYFPSNFSFDRLDYKKYIEINFEVVQIEDLASIEGKLRYFKFIESNKNASPVVRLFGRKAEGLNIPKAEAKKHINKLRFCLHPDKGSSDDERTFLNTLSQSVNEAYTEMKNGSSDQNTCLAEFHDDMLDCALKTANWLQIKNLSKNKPQFTPLSAIREGNFALAIESCFDSDLFIDVIPILERCQKNISVHPSLENIPQLLESLTEIQNLKDLFETRLRISSLVDIVPHNLYSTIAACYQNSANHPVEYEKYMRLAIRCCLQKEEKKLLIIDLKKHVEAFGKSLEPKEYVSAISKKISEICENFKEMLTQNSITTLTDLINVFQQNRNDPDSEKLICEMNKEYLYMQVTSAISNCFFSIFYLSGNSEQLSKFSHYINLIKGIYSYQKGEYLDAINCFKDANDHFFQAFCQYKNSNYQEALESLAKVAEADPFIDELSFKIMNEHDFADALTIQSTYRLREVDKFQLYRS